MRRSSARSAEAIEFARLQRRCANEFALTVWQWIRNRQILGLKFRREVPLPPYTADFCCVELKLVIEIDGADHSTPAGKKHDRVRDAWLRSRGYRILRVAGYEVSRDGAAVNKKISGFVVERNPCILGRDDPARLSTDDPSPPAPLP